MWHLSPTDLLRQKQMKARHEASKHDFHSPQRPVLSATPPPPPVCTHTSSTCFSCLLQNPIFLSYVPFNPRRLTDFLSSFICAVIGPASSINTCVQKPGRPHTLQQLYSIEAISSISPQLSHYAIRTCDWYAG